MKKSSFGIAVVLSVSLTACWTETPPPNPETIIPVTTKVADPTTQTALSAFEPKTGTMRFSQNTLELQNLKPNDVLVGEPSSAAPYGYLRKVKAIRAENGQQVLETSQANLTDAISKGALDANGSLTPARLQSVKILQPGVKAQTRLGDGFDYRVDIDTTFRPKPPGTGEIHVTGFLRFNLGYHIGLDISFCLSIVCLDKFEATAGFDQETNLKITGHLETPLKEDKELATYSFKPITFFIGPVPVVIVPKVTASVGMDGVAKVQFSYEADQKAKLLVGARWTDSNGWQDISDHDFSFTPGQPQATGSVKVKGFGSFEGQLLLYNIAGPGLNASVGLEFDAAVPRNPVWILNAFISADFTFVVDLPVIGKVVDFSANLIEFSKELARSPNSKPTITILQNAINVDLGKSVDLINAYSASDLEDGDLHYSKSQLVSDVDGALPVNTNGYTFASEGLRTITVTVTDSNNASSSATFTVSVLNAPPVPFGVAPGDTVQQGVPYYISVGASDVNTGRLDCGALRWTVSPPDVAITLNGGSSCQGKIVFNVKGLRTARLTATDPQGAFGSKDFQVTVTDPPLVPPPDITQMVVRDSFGDLLPEQGKVCINLCAAYVTLSIGASDPSNLPLTKTWTVDCVGAFCPVGYHRVLSPNPDGTVTFHYQVGDPLGDDAISKITVTVGNGKTAVAQSRTLEWYIVVR